MKVVRTRARQSDRSREVCAMFGIRVASATGDPARSRVMIDAAARIDRLLPPGRVALITGPSGGGKSSLLRAFAGLIRERGGPVEVADLALSGGEQSAPIVDLLGDCSQKALRWLSRVGLAEPALFPLRADELSEGQRFRLAVARAMRRLETREEGHGANLIGTDAAPDLATGHPPGTVLVDEFGSSLDPTSAVTLGAALRRCAERTGIRVVCAGVRDEAMETLGAAVLAVCPLAGEVRVYGSGGPARNERGRAA